MIENILIVAYILTIPIALFVIFRHDVTPEDAGALPILVSAVWPLVVVIYLSVKAIDKFESFAKKKSRQT